jgi:outer membrane protein OmpA-like peptidoglycan-associated protein
MNTILPKPKGMPAGLVRGAVAVVAVMALAGCAPKYYVDRVGCPAPCAPDSYVVLIPSPDGTVGNVVVKGDQGEQALGQAGQAATTGGQAFKVDEKRIKEDFGAAMAALPRVPVRYVLYFSDSVTLTPASDAELSRIVAEARERPAVDVTIIGHTDTLQSVEFNDRLGLKRASRIAELLRERGLKTDSIAVESRGERNPAVPTKDNVFEPKNRRVEISVR